MRVLIPIADGFEDSEFFYPYYRLREAGIEVDVAGPDSSVPVAGKHGYTFTPGLGFDAVAAAHYDALVVPGGKGPETVRLNENIVQVTRDLVEADKPVAAICHGLQVLISAQVLQARQATCWQGIRDDIKTAGAEYEDAEVVVDKHLVTSRCPSDLPAFMRAFMKLLA